MGTGRLRIDKLLVDRGLVSSRDRAQRLILAGAVWIGDQRVRKASDLVPPDADVDVRADDLPFVSRGGLKLAGALDQFGIVVTDLVALDVGASTGGFTDCLLQRGARRVYAVDVGYGQFAWSLRGDSRVVLFERTNIRGFDASHIPERVDLAVIDVSFISLRLVLPAIIPFLRVDALVLPMVKPQFEVGKGRVGSGGVVRDPALHAEVIAEIRAVARAIGLTCHGVAESCILGPRGNREFFLHLQYSNQDPMLQPSQKVT